MSDQLPNVNDVPDMPEVKEYDSFEDLVGQLTSALHLAACSGDSRTAQAIGNAIACASKVAFPNTDHEQDLTDNLVALRSSNTRLELNLKSNAEEIAELHDEMNRAYEKCQLLQERNDYLVKQRDEKAEQIDSFKSDLATSYVIVEAELAATFERILRALPDAGLTHDRKQALHHLIRNNQQSVEGFMHLHFIITNDVDIDTADTDKVSTATYPKVPE